MFNFKSLRDQLLDTRAENDALKAALSEQEVRIEELCDAAVELADIITQEDGV